MTIDAYCNFLKANLLFFFEFFIIAYYDVSGTREAQGFVWRNHCRRQKKKFKKAEKGGGAKKQRGEKCTIEAEVFGARSTTVSKETYNSVKRDLQQCQKSPTTVSKETYYSVKRDLLQCQTIEAEVFGAKSADGTH